MARPEIKGLKYFPFDVGFFGDRKVRLLRGENGSDGVEVYIRLLTKCYEDNGYFLLWDEDEDYALLAEETGYPEDKIRLIVSTCLRRSLFSDTLFKVGNVLTSRGIQRRYFSAIKDTKAKAAAQGRYTYVDKDLCLLTEDDFSELNKTHVWLKVTQKTGFSEKNASKSENKSAYSENNPPNERKGNKNKGDPPAAPQPGPPSPPNPPKPSKGKYADDSDEMKLSLFLAEKMQENNPTCRLPKDGYQGWCEYMNKLIRIDGRSPNDIKRIISFSQWHDFWKINILSARNLRKHWDRLYLERKKEVEKRSGDRQS